MKRKIKKKNSLLMVVIIYFVILSTISFAYSFFYEKLLIEGKSSFSSLATRIYNYEYQIIGKWETDNVYNYIIDSVITYKGTDNIAGWILNIKVDSDTEVVGCFNSDSCTIKDNILTIKNAYYNGNLSPSNNSVSLETHIKTTNNNYQVEVLSIEFIKENDNINTPPEEIEKITGIDIKTSLEDDWGTKKHYVVKITNNTSFNIKDYELVLELPDDALVGNIWNAEYIYKDNKAYISGPSWQEGIELNNIVEINIIYDSPSSLLKMNIISFTGTLENGKKIEAIL